MSAGVVLNPHTSVSLLENIIADVDLVLLMSVNPGYGGTKNYSHTYSKNSGVQDIDLSKKLQAKIEM